MKGKELKKKKLNLVFSQKQLNKIETVRKEIGITSKNAFFQYAAAFFLWAIEQKKAGLTISAYNEKERKEIEFLLPSEVDAA